MKKPFSLRDKLMREGIVDEDELRRHLLFAHTLAAKVPGLDLRRYSPRKP